MSHHYNIGGNAYLSSKTGLKGRKTFDISFLIVLYLINYNLKYFITDVG